MRLLFICLFLIAPSVFAADVTISQSGGTGTVRVESSAATGDITEVTAGSGLTGGGTSGAVTVTVGAGTGITVNADDVQVQDNGITATQLSATLTFADGDLLDLDGITANTATEGILLPVFNSGATGEGQLSWDPTNDRLYSGDGTTALPLNIIILQGSSITSEGADFWSQPGGGATGTEANADQWVCPVALECFNLYAELRDAPGGSGNYNVSCNIDGTADSDVTFSIAGASKSGNDNTGFCNCTQGQSLNVEFDETVAAASTGGHAWSMICRVDGAL